MNTNLARAASLGAAFLIMFLSGFWLNRKGKPYDTLIFTIHKMIGLGMGIFLYMTIRQIHRTASLDPIEILLVAFTVLSFLATVTTGSLLSVPVSKPMPDIVSTLNKIFPYITVLSTAITSYFLL
ncbi:MAG: hypothetical protein C3F07_18395 [Anaerolineales bacterium]|nr:hypothetical protein [Anaerolineae bacterium]PWB69912.1 MAG: hypothetical protein C3F07_18395 [Anaerolineales bacterium]